MSKANWEGYTDYVEKNIPTSYKAKNVNKLEKTLRKVMTMAANKFIGKKRVDRNSKPWMTDEIKRISKPGMS